MSHASVPLSLAVTASVPSTLGFLPLPLCSLFLAFSFHCRSFPRVGLLLFFASTLWGLSRDCFSWVKSELRHHRCWGGVYSFLAPVSLQQKFATTDGLVLQPSDGPLLQSGVISSDGSVLQPYVISSDRPMLQRCYSLVLFRK